jgi:DNA-binding NtrC family response regulator
MSGRALIERLDAARPETRIVAMSGYSRSDDDASIPKTITLLRKPFTNTQLFSTLRAAMSSAPVVVEPSA